MKKIILYALATFMVAFSVPAHAWTMDFENPCNATPDGCTFVLYDFTIGAYRPTFTFQDGYPGYAKLENTDLLSTVKIMGTPISTVLNSKLNVPSGTSSQCVLGDGTVGSCPAGSVAWSSLTGTAPALSTFSGTLPLSSITGTAAVASTGSAADVSETATRKWFTAAEQTKLAGLSTGATANQTDAYLLNRSNHTGTQTASTISDFASTARGLISVSGAGSYNSGTGVITVNSPAAVSISSATRSLNSNYTISTTRAANVAYSINVQWTIQALLSGTATAYLEYSINGGTNWNLANQVSKTIGLLTFAGNDDLNLVGNIPANALVRIRTTSTNMTVSYTAGQEMQY